MIAAVLAAVLGSAPPAASGEWLVVTVNRVIAPDQHPGECFVQARVDQVVRGRVYRPGDAIAISLACRAGGLAPVRWSGEVFNPDERILGREAPTLETLRLQRRALVHVDAGGRVLDNGWWGLSGLRPAPGRGSGPP